MIRAPFGTRRPRRARAIGMGAVVLLGVVLGARPADAAAADPPGQALRLAYLQERAASASRALAAYATRLAEARDAGRRGAALVQSGDEPAEPALEEAAALLEAAIPESEAAAAALDELRGVAQAVLPAAGVASVAGPADLRGIAGQLRQAAGAAEPVVSRRLAAMRTLEQLQAALAALDADEPTTALRALAAARAERAMLAAWSPEPVTLPLWLRTTERLIRAAEGIASATLAGDAVAARRAARRYAGAVDQAQRADVSLALTLTEAANGLTATPMRRLATALAGVEQARAAVASLVLIASAR